MKVLLELNKYFLRHKTKLIFGIIFILCSNITQIFIPLFLKKSIDLINGDASSVGLRNYALMIVGASIIAGGFRFLIRETIIVVSREIEYDLRQDFWSRLITLPLKFFNDNSTGNLMAHATNDIGAVRMYVGPAFMYSIDTGIRIILIVSIMLGIDWRLTLFTLLPLPLLSFFVYKLSSKIHKLFTKIQEKFSELTSKAQENISGMRVIKSYVREEGEKREFEKLSGEYLDRNMAQVKVQAMFMPIMFLISGVSVIIVILVGGIGVIEGRLTIGDISAFIVYLGMLIWPMIAFGWVMNIIQQAAASLKRIKKIINEKAEILDSPKAELKNLKINGEIEFRNVSFRYRENLPYVLKNVSFKIEAGKTAALVGRTGTGKSTLINLIPRLFDVEEGEILIDGHKIKDIPLRLLRSSISVVPQETFLFSDTLINNILYGSKSGNKKEALKAAEISELDKDAEEFPDKYETMLGERGLTLSGGQKQRACLSRALAAEPRILLLDDSFSAVDTNTEEEILNNLRSFMKERTNIIISHRISTVKDADIIFVLDKGQIVEKGKHDELIDAGGIYADMHFKQLLEKELKEIV